MTAPATAGEGILPEEEEEGAKNLTTYRLQMPDRWDREPKRSENTIFLLKAHFNFCDFQIK